MSSTTVVIGTMVRIHGIQSNGNSVHPAVVTAIVSGSPSANPVVNLMAFPDDGTPTPYLSVPYRKGLSGPQPYWSWTNE